MERIQTEIRKDWENKLEGLGFGYHSLEGLYWDESHYYQFTGSEIEAIENATAELWQMCLEAVDHVIAENLWERFNIPQHFRDYIVTSWEEDHPSIYGRFDFGFDGKNLKLLEFNADTPTSLYEASVIQWYWLQDMFPDRDQFNSIHEKLIDYWKYLTKYMNPRHIYFTSLTNIEDVTNVEYMRDCATQAGFETEFIPVQDIGWADDIEEFISGDQTIMEYIFKLYPYEWILEDGFSEKLVKNAFRSQWIEPAWKVLLSSKAILPVLWKLYPDHPYLLEAYFDGPKDMKDYARKPVFSREGANVTLYQNRVAVEHNEGGYEKEGFIYQKLFKLPDFDGNHPVIGSWVIGQEPAGIGIRESVHLITNNQSRFIPHLISG
ncbi:MULTISPECIES: glutathionylspermidine synthase family protein [Chryseobacterium]|uniref:Glutathionylspermidine synthase n=1 Tax=Chryseobacterium camelliae TaxID=1265445 RepID=A0ABU0TM69_9FLAO|nr:MULTISPECIES: glutathionylspermidine synthase family protein [Chryseobacterium]MDT3408054.1 glutathionylspermidine synthase [Pseudacidovorax intermedius]MDQ1098091.1 glutathionylspermidine synthase [Chryseobacterium camelliae]MDQ1102021.1 glutathionylspermidine synthase [Chryseobacterium sp. SORGH_AS_1048]MDR6085457.1 glutathionylspermidine synthase [Chryseobacterium sp. SORGH_AS_0909]MDR6129821.1 glutathionylspermidine synthase [Chryseobacterium sp. SORGH_AS_1175]